MRERTVAFYEIVEVRDADQFRLDQLPWPQLLAATARTSVTERTVEESGSTFVGSVATYDEEDHLAIHRVKDPGEWLSVLDWNTGEWRELESRAAQGFLETSVACFLPYGNVVALMRGTTSSPTHRAIVDWINGMKFFSGRKLAIRPVMSRSQVEQLQRADGASRVEIKLGSSTTAQLNTLSQRGGRLARVLRSAGEDYGDVDVTVIISIPRGNNRSSERRELLEDLRDLSDIMPAAERARATLTYMEDGGGERSQFTEFVEHAITAKRRVAAVDENGDAVRISSSVAVILDAAAEHEEELRTATDAN